MTGRAIMVQGTASSVGKSIVVTAMCRHFCRRGLRVAPFKAQNMALNASVTPCGHEIGRAQAVQAEAARVVPTVDMNPILLKPEGDARSQVVLLGRAIGSLSAVEYQTKKPELRALVGESLRRLRSTHDVVVIEGAGSPAEINLKEHDLVNMFVANLADCKVVLVGDIDRGGVFAALVGTMELLEPHERMRVGAFLINKFRGDLRLLEPGLQFLRERTGIPVLGVLPYIRKLRIADEDSASLDARRARPRAGPDEVEIVVIRVPHLANYDDFQPLEHEAGVVVRFVDAPQELDSADLVVLPGTKSTVADLQWLHESGLARVLVDRSRRCGPTLGICGGCQMLGRTIADPDGVESDVPLSEGLGLLPLTTHFSREKRTTQVRAVAVRSSFLGAAGGEVQGYEIHMGRTTSEIPGECAFAVRARNGAPDEGLDGAVSADGSTVGTMIHGLFENPSVRRTLLAEIRARKGLPPLASTPASAVADEYDRLADVLRENVDGALLDALLRP